MLHHLIATIISKASPLLSSLVREVYSRTRRPLCVEQNYFELLITSCDIRAASRIPRENPSLHPHP